MSMWRALVGERAQGRLERLLRAAALAAVLATGAGIVQASFHAARTGAVLATRRAGERP